MLGNFKIRVRDGTEQIISPINIIRYWNYSDSYPQDDLMLIKLSKSANFSHKVQPLDLATSNVRPGTVCLLSGLDWSRDNTGECTPTASWGHQLYLERGTHVYITEKRGQEIGETEGRDYTSGLAKRDPLRV